MSLGVAGINTVSQSTQGQTSTLKGSFDQNAFLQLLVTELRYQNPTNPMGSGDFISQTAQFSSLDQMTQMNTNIKALIDLEESSNRTANRTAAMSLIGKQVVANHSQLSLSGSSPVSLSYSLSENAKVTVSIFDDNSNCIRVIDAGAQTAGQHNLVWDGLDDDGVKAQDGNYSYNIYAVNANGNKVESSETLSGIVDGLILGSEPYISIGGVRVPLSSLSKVSLATT